MSDFSKQLQKIEFAIKAFIADSEPFLLNFDEPINLRLLAELLNFLPISFNFSACYGLLPNGKIVVLDFDKDPPYELELELEPRICRSILFKAAMKFPGLAELKPERPTDAVDCNSCRGMGIHPINQELGFVEERVVCWCGGLGWLDKDEKQLF